MLLGHRPPAVRLDTSDLWLRNDGYMLRHRPHDHKHRGAKGSRRNLTPSDTPVIPFLEVFLMTVTQKQTSERKQKKKSSSATSVCIDDHNMRALGIGIDTARYGVSI